MKSKQPWRAEQRLGDNSGLVRAFPELALLDELAERHVVVKKATSALLRRPKTWLLCAAMLLCAAIVAAATVLVFLLRPLVAPLPPVLSNPGMMGGIVGGICGGLSTWIVFRLGRRQMQASIRTQLRERGLPVCLRCGYDLRGNESGVCPECGTAHDGEPCG